MWRESLESVSSETASSSGSTSQTEFMVAGSGAGVVVETHAPRASMTMASRKRHKFAVSILPPLGRPHENLERVPLPACVWGLRVDARAHPARASLLCFVQPKI